MAMNASEIRLLTEGDLAAAARLRELAQWNQTGSDWRRLLALEPRGCFAAWLDGQLVATTTTTTYGTELAWIGMVLVDPAYRRRGLASQLMRTALDYLHTAGVEAIKLDATPDGQAVYEGFGFLREGLVERWSGHSGAAVDDGLRLDSELLPQVWALDREAFGADRQRLLEKLLGEACVEPAALCTADGRLRGYALARRGARAAYIGPLVAGDCAAARRLLDAMLSRLRGAAIYFDFHTGGLLNRDDLRARGFEKQRDLIRMNLGGCGAGTSPFICAIAGPEVG